MRNSGFTLIELMVAMVVGLIAITSVYTLGAAMSQRFYEEQRLASSQGTSRVAIMELRRDISRAGLFGSPNGQLEPTCDATPPTLPQLGGSDLPLGAFQYYADQDLALLDPGNNTDVHADRLRVLSSLYLSDPLVVASVSVDGLTIVLETSNQAYRRTFSWGQTAGPFTAGLAPDYLAGDLNWDDAWSSETASWKGIGQTGARAFQTGSVLHIETPQGRHFFRSAFGKAGNTSNQVRIALNPALPLPVGTACLPGAAEGSTIAPLQWVEYAIVDPFDEDENDFMAFGALFSNDVDNPSPAADLVDVASADAPGLLRESPNRVLVRRILDASTGDPTPSSTQVIAEFVSNFRVEFLLDTNSGSTAAPNISDVPLTGDDQATINASPQQVRSVIIHLGIRSPLEDPALPFVINDDGTRFEVDPAQVGSARVRHMRIEVPVMNVARRNL